MLSREGKPDALLHSLPIATLALPRIAEPQTIGLNIVPDTPVGVSGISPRESAAPSYFEQSIALHVAKIDATHTFTRRPHSMVPSISGARSAHSTHSDYVEINWQLMVSTMEPFLSE